MISDSEGVAWFTQMAGSSMLSPAWVPGTVSPSDGISTGDSAPRAGPLATSTPNKAGSIDRTTTAASWRARASDTEDPPIHETVGNLCPGTRGGNEAGRLVHTTRASRIGSRDLSYRRHPVRGGVDMMGRYAAPS